MQYSRKHRKFWNEKETRFLRNTLPQIKRSPGQFLKTNVLRWNRYLGSHKLKLTSLFCPLLVSSLPTSMSSFVKWRKYCLIQWSPTFLAPGICFHERQLVHRPGEWGRFWFLPAAHLLLWSQVPNRGSGTPDLIQRICAKIKLDDIYNILYNKINQEFMEVLLFLLLLLLLSSLLLLSLLLITTSGRIWSWGWGNTMVSAVTFRQQHWFPLESLAQGERTGAQRHPENCQHWRPLRMLKTFFPTQPKAASLSTRLPSALRHSLHFWFHTSLPNLLCALLLESS